MLHVLDRELNSGLMKPLRGGSKQLVSLYNNQWLDIKTSQDTKYRWKILYRNSEENAKNKVICKVMVNFARINIIN